jgi:4-hydroxybenzoate polyprenyltransferase
MAMGVILAFFYRPDLFAWPTVVPLAVAVLAACLVSSSNYVLNELLDSSRDALHPTKRLRPVPSGQVRRGAAYAEWLALGAAGIGLALAINRPFGLSAIALWSMGLVYNVPPIRTKEWPYLDVLSESVNSPIRLLLGWFAVVDDRIPPVSLTLAYWMAGAFFMGAKRLAEYRQIGDARVAAAYRSSFEHYTDEHLIVSLLFYSNAAALFLGVFIVHYHVELVLFVPVAAALAAYYFRLAVQPDSPMQDPERLFRNRRFLAYTLVGTTTFIVLMFVRVPLLYEWFSIEPASADRVLPLWTIGPQRP